MAWVSSIEAILAADPEEANRRHFNELREYPRLRPVPVINPRLRGWRTALDKYRDEERIEAVKIPPKLPRLPA